MKSGALMGLLFSGSLAACSGAAAPCERVAGPIQMCRVYDEADRLHEVYVAGAVDAPPSQDYVRLLARGVTGGPNVVAVDTCGTRDRILLLEGLFDTDTTSAAFGVEDLTGNFAGTREAVQARRDSLLTARTECLVRDER